MRAEDNDTLTPPAWLHLLQQVLQTSAFQVARSHSQVPPSPPSAGCPKWHPLSVLLTPCNIDCGAGLAGCLARGDCGWKHTDKGACSVIKHSSYCWAFPFGWSNLEIVTKDYFAFLNLTARKQVTLHQKPGWSLQMADGGWKMWRKPEPLQFTPPNLTFSFTLTPHPVPSPLLTPHPLPLTPLAALQWNLRRYSQPGGSLLCWLT